MFRTSSVHHQERFVQAVFSDFGTRITTYQSLRIQLVQNAPNDGPMKTTFCTLLDYIYIFQDDTRSLQCRDAHSILDKEVLSEHQMESLYPSIIEAIKQILLIIEECHFY